MASAERANHSLAALFSASCVADPGMGQRVMARYADYNVWVGIAEAGWHAGAGLGLDWRCTRPACLLCNVVADRPAHRLRALPLFRQARSRASENAARPRLRSYRLSGGICLIREECLAMSSRL